MDKRLVPLLASSAFFAWPAMAQNAVPPTFDWTGFYVGLIGGYGWGDFDVESSGQIVGPPPIEIPYDDFSVDANGGFIGGQVGFDKQIGSFVFGVVGDWSASDIEGDGSTSIYFEDDFVGEFGASGQINWFASIRGKAGYAFERILIYGTAGIVFGETETDFWYDFENPIIFDPAVDGSETHTGYALGLGMAAMLTPNLMAEFGYLFMDLGDQSYSLVGEDDFTAVGEGEIDFSSHLLRFGISYKF